jgi:hypothetical protein
MKARLPVLISAGLVFFALTGLARQRVVDPVLSAQGQRFESVTATANGIQQHYVRGGSGPALILLHGFPQDWREWHRVMPRLAQRFTVVAPDLRGTGRSQLTQTGYDAATLAADIHGWCENSVCGTCMSPAMTSAAWWRMPTRGCIQEICGA